MTRDEIMTLSEQFLLEIRLSAIQECIRRTRLALLISFFAALVTLMCLWNSEFSFEKLSYFATDRFSENSGPIIAGAANSSNKEADATLKIVKEELTKQTVAHWMNGIYITIPILGVTVSATDFSIYNSAAMLFLIMYLLLSERRENREIGTLVQNLVAGMYLNEIRDENHKAEIRQTVYRAICAFMIFNNPTKNDKPIQMLYSEEPNDRQQTKILFLRPLISGIFWFPFASIVATFAYNAIHYLRGFNLHPLGQWQNEIALSCFALELVSGALVLNFTLKTLGFHNATKKIVSAFRDYHKPKADPLGIPCENLREV